MREIILLLIVIALYLLAGTEKQEPPAEPLTAQQKQEIVSRWYAEFYPDNRRR